MKVIKKINNNVAVAIDYLGNEVIIIGKGVGFNSMPYILKDTSVINRTFYNIDSKYMNLFERIDSRVFNLAGEIVDYGSNLIAVKLNPNIVFTLADHIDASIKMCKENIIITNPLKETIIQLYPIEYDIGEYSVKLIEKEMGIQYKSDEAASIALHFINTENNMYNTIQATEIIAGIVDIIQNEFQVKLDVTSIDHSRFVLHIRFLVVRHDNKNEISTDNKKMFSKVKTINTTAYKCLLKIIRFMETEYQWKLDEEEQLYLLLHINRLIK